LKSIPISNINFYLDAQMMMKQTILCVWLCILFGLSSSVSAQKKSISEQFALVQESITVREVDAAQTIGPLIKQLGETKTSSDRMTLLQGIIEIARETSPYPSYIKAYIQTELPPVVLSLASNTNLDWTVRGTALMALRSISASKAQLEQAIQIAQTDTSKNKDFIISRGKLLQSYLDGLLNKGITQVEISITGDRTKEREAIAFLRTRGHNPTYDQLLSSISEFEPLEVTALFDANTYSAQHRKSDGGFELWTSLTSGCARHLSAISQAPTLINIITTQGLDINIRDDLNNSPLLLAVQYCPLTVIRAMVEKGAKVNVFNAQEVSELTMALVVNKWDVATFLIDSGSRLSKKSIDEVFLESPEEPAKLAILKKAESKP
jgi:hypothetical protein